MTWKKYQNQRDVSLNDWRPGPPPCPQPTCAPSQTGHQGVYGRRRNLWATDPHCFYCRAKLELTSSTIDHKIPRSKGGTNAEANTVLCCYPCNHSKGDMMPDEWEEYRKTPSDQRKSSERRLSNPPKPKVKRLCDLSPAEWDQMLRSTVTL